MRGDIVYRVCGDKDTDFGTFLRVDEAKAEVAKLMARDGGSWAAKHHKNGFVVREVVVDTDFEIPSRPKPRDLYCITATKKNHSPGTWATTDVEIFRRIPNGLEPICTYERNYAMLQTFEPFRQGDRHYALISRNYTTSAVLDLLTGEVIAEESDRTGAGFCPVGFYVPDWWDVNDGSVIPGSKYWNADKEWPTGDFAFVWGCCWGDDSSWKVQYLDLSRIREGIITREERFGYVEIATAGFENACLTTEPPAATGCPPPHFIRVSKYNGVTGVQFSVEMGFDLTSGQSPEWSRLKITNME